MSFLVRFLDTVPAKVYLSRVSLVKFSSAWDILGLGRKVSGMNLGPRPSNCPVPIGGLL